MKPSWRSARKTKFVPALRERARWKQAVTVNNLSPVGAAVARSLDMGKVIGSIPILGTILLTKKASFVVLGFFGYVGLRPFTVHSQSPTPRKKLFYFEKFRTLAAIIF